MLFVLLSAAHGCSCRACLAAGLAPLTESYCLVIAAFVKDGNYRVAKAVFESMVRSGMDARSGWLTLTKSCILAGCAYMPLG